MTPKPQVDSLSCGGGGGLSRLVWLASLLGYSYS